MAAAAARGKVEMAVLMAVLRVAAAMEVGAVEVAAW